MTVASRWATKLRDSAPGAKVTAFTAYSIMELQYAVIGILVESSVQKHRVDSLGRERKDELFALETAASVHCLVLGQGKH